MAEADTDLQPVNAVDAGVPAESPTATESAAPEPTTETSGDDTATESQAEREKPKGGFQRRISELTRAQRELREELARERAAREAMERSREQPTEDEPQRDKYASWDEYEREHVRWVARQEIRAETSRAEAERQQREMQQQAVTAHQAWESRLDAARDKFEDIDDYVDAVGERINPILAEAIKAADKGPELVRHLGQNPKELDRISTLPPIQAMYALAQIEARLQAQPKASSAPAPGTPVKTTTAPANALRDESDVKSWIEARRRQVRG